MEHVTTYYKTLFGSYSQSNLSLSDNFQVGRHTLSLEQKNSLTTHFQEEEVKKAIFDMRVDSSLDLNGFGSTSSKLSGQ